MHGMESRLPQKELGAYYTPSKVAETLVKWAVRDAEDRVLDPCCGDGVFVEAAASRVAALGGRPSFSVFGIELDLKVFRQSLAPLLGKLSIPECNVSVSDFFDVTTSQQSPCQAVVGNPPFIRYQTFKGTSREKALSRARALGVGVLCGGYGQHELEQAGAFRVYDDPADLLKRIDEIVARS